MNKIAEKLIEFGMDFEYENYGSQGEKIVSHQALLEVTKQNGFIYFEYEGQTSIFDESINPKSMNIVLRMVEDALINETT